MPRAKLVENMTKKELYAVVKAILDETFDDDRQIAAAPENYGVCIPNILRDANLITNKEYEGICEA